MELKQAIYQRTSVRLFREKPVPKELIEELVLAGQQAPSACNKQAWRFVAVSDKLKRERMVKQAGSHPLAARAPLAMVAFETAAVIHRQVYLQRCVTATVRVCWIIHILFRLVTSRSRCCSG